MNTYVIDQPDVTGIPVRGSDKSFPIRRIYCIGRNYAAHTIEMGVILTAKSHFSFRRMPRMLIRQAFSLPNRKP